ncbi:allophanate hydrolase [Methylocystis parvus]|uniref:allophanate hydrolase n=1 Tax=Methylocystis parvus TaxID=134 RepID=UPI003C758A92
MIPTILDFVSLEAGYRAGAFTPLDVAHEVLSRIAAGDAAIWISLRDSEDILADAAALMEMGGHSPLWGLPFAVKDNIDVAGLETTAACPEFAYAPQVDAVAVARLKQAGALFIGKTNLDQFATGLNGTRSPYGAPRCVFDRAYISGGSSSGSAVAVASGHVAFALGTDTAGSGRVPAAFNNIVGVKPTRGLVSTTGVVPACRSLDCVTVFAATVGDADRVRRVMQCEDAVDAFSRAMTPVALPRGSFRVGVLSKRDREFFGDVETEALYDAAISRLKLLGGAPFEIDYAPFRDCAALLYGGPWVAERLTAIKGFFEDRAEAIEPTVREIISGAQTMTATDAFEGVYALQAFHKRAAQQWAKMDVLLLPTTPTIYTVEALRAAPVTLNSNLGRYTNFVNLLDYSAVAIPGGFRKDGLPAGVTLIAPAFADDALAVLADRLHRAAATGMGQDRNAFLPNESALTGRDSGYISIVVIGAHLTGMPLNHQLVDGGGTFDKACRTAPDYRLFALPGTVPPKPGLMRDPDFAGSGVEAEVWRLPPAAFAAFVDAIPAPLGVGKITLDDGAEASGFLCESHALRDAEEITGFGGWRAYLASRAR